MSKRDLLRTTVVLPRVLHEEVKGRAELLGTSVSEVVRTLLLEWAQYPLPELFTREREVEGEGPPSG